MIRYLLFSSVVVVLGCAAKTQPAASVRNNDNQCLASATPALKSELYNASVEVHGNHISGLMFFKTMADSSQNVVFTTETGLTFFNFSWDKNGKFSVQHVIRKLDRNVVINLIRRDLELILIPESYRANGKKARDGSYAVELKKETAFLFVSQDCTSLEKAEVRHKDKIKTSASFFSEEKNIPDSVNIQHLNFNMQLALSRLNRDHAPE